MPLLSIIASFAPPRRIYLLPVLGLLTAVFMVAAAAPPGRPANVDAHIWRTLDAHRAADRPPTADFLVMLTAQADISAAHQLTDKTAKGRYVYDRLRTTAARSQADLRRLLQDAGVPHRPFWAANMIWVHGDESIIHTIAARPEVAHLYANPTVAARLPQPEIGRAVQADAVWGVEKINAPAVWAEGVTGQGVVVGGQDTGYRWTHEAVRDRYRGWDGISVTHDYNWHDAIDSGGGICGANTVAPCDDWGHGTHTLGTMLGRRPDGHALGVAPDAEWIGCRNMDVGNGTPATYAECFEWFIAPYPVGGDPFNDGDPARAPHVIGNSWSCPPSEGCNPDSLRTVVENVRAAGIVSVQAAGNYGPSCGSVYTPAAIHDASFTIGNTTSSDTISSSSSRGPVTADGSGRMKPDLAAPGTAILSAYAGDDGDYRTTSGTSMAAPHVVGAIALLISADPTLAGDVDRIEQLLRDSALSLTTTQGCGSDTDTAVPNNVYGHGRLDVWAAYQALQPDTTFLPAVFGFAPTR